MRRKNEIGRGKFEEKKKFIIVAMAMTRRLNQE